MTQRSRNSLDSIRKIVRETTLRRIELQRQVDKTLTAEAGVDAELADMDGVSVHVAGGRLKLCHARACPL